MKNLTIFLIALFIICAACQRSQFSTTTRHSRNGRVTYVNHYPAERIRSSMVTVHKSHLQGTDAKNRSLVPITTGLLDSKASGITVITPVPFQRDENLIASNSKEPILVAPDENRITYVSPDTTKSTASKKGTARDSITKQVIKYKNGHKEDVRIISQSRDTLKYELVSEHGVVRLVSMGQVDSILLVKSCLNKKKVADTRKTEPLGKVGLIFSIIGFLPVIGIPFSLLAIVFGAVSLHKINRHPERFKGKNIATTSLVLGILSIVIWGLLILLLSAGGGPGGVSMGMGA